MASGSLNENAGSSTAIFDAAKQQFIDSLGSLSPHYKAHFTPCSSGEEIIVVINNLPSVAKERALSESRGVKFCDRLVTRLQTYFKVVDVVVSVDPLHAATAWGAIRLIFQLTSNYVTFSGKVASALEDLGSQIPMYDRVVQGAPHQHLLRGRCYESYLRYVVARLVRIFELG
ncbi:hypothetical protein ACHAPT_012819 [Fusarium lateritium]